MTSPKTISTRRAWQREKKEELRKEQKTPDGKCIVEMLKDGALTEQKIAALAKVSIEYVTQIIQELKA